MTAVPTRRVVIAGASAAGLSVAETLRREGFDGSVTLIGQERHLPYDRPPLSKQILTGAWPAERTALRPTNDIDALRLDLRLGVSAAELSTARRTVTLTDGTEIGYDSLVVATGVRPRRLLQGDVPGLHVLRTLDDALGLRDRIGRDRRLVVVGAGFLGAEVASSARSLGAEVTLVEPTPVPLAQAVGHQAGDRLARLHRENGVDLRLGTKVIEIVTTSAGVTGVRLSDGTLVAADDVLVAIGSEPNTEWLRGSGLDLADGVVCDAYSAAAPGLYAAGDVARWHNPLFDTTMRVEHRTNAAEQGVAVARHILRPEQAKPFAPIPYFWSDQHGTRVQAYGCLRGHDEARLVEGDFEDGRFLMVYRRGRTLVGALAVGMPAKSLRRWRTAVSEKANWRTALTTEPPAPAA